MNLPPSNYSKPSMFVQWLHGLRNEEFDAYTGHWVRKGWIEERQALMDNAPPPTAKATCLLCNQAMLLHTDPRRMWSADPAYCPEISS